jgi:hypothetical protein
MLPLKNRNYGAARRVAILFSTERSERREPPTIRAGAFKLGVAPAADCAEHWGLPIERTHADQSRRPQ